MSKCIRLAIFYEFSNTIPSPYIFTRFCDLRESMLLMLAGWLNLALVFGSPIAFDIACYCCEANSRVLHISCNPTHRIVGLVVKCHQLLPIHPRTNWNRKNLTNNFGDL